MYCHNTSCLFDTVIVRERWKPCSTHLILTSIEGDLVTMSWRLVSKVNGTIAKTVQIHAVVPLAIRSRCKMSKRPESGNDIDLRIRRSTW